jgi:hypothetical protein
MKTNKITSLLIKSLGLTILVVLSINIIGLLIAYLNLQDKTIHSLLFDEGVFTLNGKEIGYSLFSLRYLFFNLVIFGLSFYIVSKKGKLLKEES